VAKGLILGAVYNDSGKIRGSNNKSPNPNQSRIDRKNLTKSVNLRVKSFGPGSLAPYDDLKLTLHNKYLTTNKMFHDEFSTVKSNGEVLTYEKFQHEFSPKTVKHKHIN